jgi:hypothetical protein
MEERSQLLSVFVNEEKQEGIDQDILEPPVPDTDDLTKKQDKQDKLPHLLIISGIIESILPAYVLFAIIPQIAKLSEAQKIPGYNPYTSYMLMGLILSVSSIQIVYGILIKDQDKKTLSPNYKKLAIIFFIFGLVTFIIIFPAATIFGIINPANNLIMSSK